ncbi:MAG TPA: amidohydrolase family protein, partial [Methylomirabilota bacterium]|nr:amidohydrolase family protein [Methylomirabilota bacterium]
PGAPGSRFEPGSWVDRFRRVRHALRLLATLLLLLASLTPAQQKPVALRGGKILTVSHGTIESGVVLFANGKIAAVGAANSVQIPKDARIIDATGMTVYPGLIDSETALGLTEISAEDMTNDLVEPSDEIMPHMHVYDAFHAESALIPVTRLNGITNAIVAPASHDTLPGQDSFIQLAGKSQTDYLLVRDIAMPLNFTGDQRRNERGEGRKYPSTRMGLAAQMRQAFLDAQDYAQKWSDYEKKKAEYEKPSSAPDSSSQSADKDKSKKSPPTPPKRDLKLEALLPYLQGKKPVILAAEESSDLQTAVNLAHEFNLKFVLNHISHSQSVLDYVASLKVPVIVGSIYEAPKPDERFDAVYGLPAQLYKRGVKIALASYDSHNARNLPYAAGFATGFGLPYDEALKAITLNAAEIWGVSDSLGSLDVGKTANVVVANGDPLDVKTDVKFVFIDGNEIPLTSRQTRLRDEYSAK